MFYSLALDLYFKEEEETLALSSESQPCENLISSLGVVLGSLFLLMKRENHFFQEMWCILKPSGGWISLLLLFCLSETRYKAFKKSCVRWNQSQLRKERNPQVQMGASIPSFFASRGLSLLNRVCKHHHCGHLAQTMVILSRGGWTLQGRLLLNPGLELLKMLGLYKLPLPCPSILFAGQRKDSFLWGPEVF